MEHKQFITYLKDCEISFVDGGDSVTVFGGYVNLNSLTTLPKGVKFDNKGYVNLNSLTTLQEGVKFENQGDVYLNSLTTLPKGVKFENQGGVNLNSLTTLQEGVKFENQGYVFLNSLTTLPKGVKFDNKGYVYLNSLTTLQEGVKFENQGYVFLNSLTTLPKGVKFDNQGYVYLNSLTTLPKGVKFENQGGVNLRSLTTLQEGVKFENQGYVFLSSLTTLPKGVKFDNKGDVYLNSLTSPHQTYRGKQVKLINVDGYTMLVTSEKTQGEYSVCKAKYFGGGDISKLKSCFLASKDNVWAHGNTVKFAIEDVQFKLIKQSNKQEVIDKIKSSKIVTVNDFRALTGACREGMRQHLSSLGIDMDSVESLTINDAIEAMKGSSFGDTFIAEMGGAS